jgi:hypothetical protein
VAPPEGRGLRPAVLSEDREERRSSRELISTDFVSSY